MTDENRKNPGIKIPHISIENSPIVEGMRCVEVWIPDDDRYARLLSGLVAIPTKWFNWQRDPTHAGKALAKQWERAYLFTEWGNCMSCDDVADCIENDEGVQDALENNLIDNINNSDNVRNALNNVYNQYGVNPMPPEVSGENLIPPDVMCDQDEIWGAIVVLIDSMHQNNIDAFEAAEAVTNAAERASLVLGGIPILETLPIDEFVTYIETIWTDDLFEAYNANDTTAYRDSLKCDLFCIATRGDCVLSIDDVYDYFISRISADPTNDLIQLVAYLVTGTWTGTQVNDMFFAGQIIMMYHGNQFFGKVGVRPFQTYMEVGKRSPSDAWELLCDICPVEYCDEMTAGLGAMTHEVSSSYPFAQWNACAVDYAGEVGGVWEASEGEGGNGAIVGVQVCASEPVSGLSIQQAAVVIDLGAEFDILEASMRFQNLDVGGSRSTILAFFDGAGTFISDYGTGQTGSLEWRTFELVGTVTGCRYISFNNVNSAGGTPKIGEICVIYQP